MRTIYIVAVSFLIAAGTHAESKAFGDWIVTTDRDRFTDKTNVVAINFTNDGAVAMRCLAGNLSLALTQARTKYTEGDIFGVDLRIDRQPVVETSGTAVCSDFIEVVDGAAEIIKEIPDGHELTVRIKGKFSQNTILFHLSKAGAKVTSLVAQSCPLDEKPDTAPGKNEKF
jgi:hypothetical protein